MTLKGRDPGKSKIVIGNKITEEVYSFNYVGNLISYENEMDIRNKLNNCLKKEALKTTCLDHRKL
jgi:hypothetical protein